MSSILDALRKLEAEKAESNQSPAGILDEVAAADELLGRGAARKKVATRFGANTLILGGLLLVVTLLVITVVYPATRTREASKPVTAIAQAVSEPAALTVSRESVSQQPSIAQPETPPVAVAAPPVVPAAPRQANAPAAPAAPVVENQPITPTPAVVIPQPDQQPSPRAASVEMPSATQPPPEPPVAKTASSEPTITPPAEPAVVRPDPVPQKAVTPPSRPEPAPQPAPEAPEVNKAVEPQEKGIVEPEEPEEPASPEEDAIVMAKADPPPPPKEQPPAPLVKKSSTRSEGMIATREKKTEPVSVFSLPVLRDSDKERYGLKDVRINMLLPATKTRPLASAIINLQTVYVGETIPGSQAILIGVEARGLAIEIEGSGQQYHMRF